MTLTPESATEALKSVKYPGYSRDIVSFGLVKNVSAHQGAVSVLLALTTPSPDVARQLKEECERVLKALPGVQHVHVEVKSPPGGAPSWTCRCVPEGTMGLHRHIWQICHRSSI